NAHNALHSVAWFVAGADGTVLGEIASGNIQTVCAFPTDLSASKSFAGTGLEAADSRIDGRLELYWLPSPSTRHHPCTRGSVDPSQAEIFNVRSAKSARRRKPEEASVPNIVVRIRSAACLARVPRTYYATPVTSDSASRKYA